MKPRNHGTTRGVIFFRVSLSVDIADFARPLYMLYFKKPKCLKNTYSTNDKKPYIVAVCKTNFISVLVQELLYNIHSIAV